MAGGMKKCGGNSWVNRKMWKVGKKKKKKVGEFALIKVTLTNDQSDTDQ